MPRVLVFVLALAAAALLGATDGSAVQSQNVKLVGTFGPGFSITLEDAQGTAEEPRARDLRHRGQGPVRGAQLPPHGSGRRPAYSGGSSDHGVLDRHADERDVQVQLRPARVHDARFLHGRSDGAATSAPAHAPARNGEDEARVTSRPAFVITLKTAKGKAVKTMKRGTYTMVVRDRKSHHNAHVVAPGFNRKTSPLTYSGSQTWKVKLRKTGTLRFLCDPHARGA